MSRLSASIVQVARLDASAQRRMFELFAEYYSSVAFERFLADLRKKDDVILLLDRRGVIQGFSTMQNLRCQVQGRKVQGLFSGDTVVAKEYWGTRVLGQAFLKYLFLQRARNPFVPYYWFLISKGYKTYLLMANNFDDHHPRVESPMTSWDKAVLDAFGSSLYPQEYDASTGLITFPESHGQLRKGIADITDELVHKYPRVAFFAERNPTWASGTELGCIARMTWSMPFKYAWKAILKTRRAPEALPVSRASRPRLTAAPAEGRS